MEDQGQWVALREIGACHGFLGDESVQHMFILFGVLGRAFGEV